jgi:hypothetical protein
MPANAVGRDGGPFRRGNRTSIEEPDARAMGKASAAMESHLDSVFGDGDVKQHVDEYRGKFDAPGRHRSGACGHRASAHDIG